MRQPDAYAKAGIDYRRIGPFKNAIVRMGRTTFSFPNRSKSLLGQTVPTGTKAQESPGGVQ